ncbi:hypothetical protein HPB51_025905 [Rhipicephalus microplus]|uniref:Uncharacterized protein n=1 Tax=Rhipicephalus microplus TaxID=6941 RepID=A0A9J6EDP0_RHIMP|nr:hypothetical protein HPB51_025905 [Rhipicephalus microplus]
MKAVGGEDPPKRHLMEGVVQVENTTTKFSSIAQAAHLIYEAGCLPVKPMHESLIRTSTSEGPRLGGSDCSCCTTVHWSLSISKGSFRQVKEELQETTPKRKRTSRIDASKSGSSQATKSRRRPMLAPATTSAHLNSCGPGVRLCDLDPDLEWGRDLGRPRPVVVEEEECPAYLHHCCWL